MQRKGFEFLLALFLRRRRRRRRRRQCRQRRSTSRSKPTPTVSIFHLASLETTTSVAATPPFNNLRIKKNKQCHYNKNCSCRSDTFLVGKHGTTLHYCILAPTVKATIHSGTLLALRNKSRQISKAINFLRVSWLFKPYRRSDHKKVLKKTSTKIWAISFFPARNILKKSQRMCVGKLFQHSDKQF